MRKYLADTRVEELHIEYMSPLIFIVNSALVVGAINIDIAT
jgi:hypothetical protein